MWTLEAGSNRRAENIALRSFEICTHRQIKSRGMSWVGNVAHMEMKRTACEILLGKAKGQTPVGRPRRR
jgi:hypothetical protein